MDNKRIWGLDIGNTHFKIGIIEGLEVIDVFRFRTERELSLDEYYFQWKEVCREIGWRQIPPVWVSSVVPSVSIALERLADKRHLHLQWITPNSNFHFEIPPAMNSQIGADILILAEAATQIVGKNAIIVSAGTATIVFVVKDGILQGGAIAPGIKGSVESLIQQAALLKPVFLEFPQQAVGQTTTDAMQSGIIYGFAGLIDRLILQMKEELGDTDFPVIACGGMIEKVRKASKEIQKVHPDLGLQGIAFLANGDKN